MEFLKTIKRRSFINEVVYIALNIGLAIGLMLIIQTTGSLWLAFAFVAVSLWRLFAVRPRFWFAHVQSNMVNIIVSFSFVILLYSANSANVGDAQVLALRSFLTILYICWLIFLKPLSKRSYIVGQAAVALFVGVTALYTLTYSWDSSFTVLAAWLIGYSTSSHILGSYDDESHADLLSLSWGLVFAEISWLAFHWTVAYRMPIIKNLLIPQVSIIALCAGFIAYKSYDSYYHHQKVRLNDVLLPVIFSLGIVLVLVLFFNGVSNEIV
ncbi:hypothetical protein HGB25_00070 [Candidatus Saccharibacteria bacterium]|nr:hypothetical protein [Candidatus Saccharibacteria bacterium]